METHKNSSFWTKGFNWFANHTYRQIPAIITSYAIKNSQPKILSFEDYIKFPELAR